MRVMHVMAGAEHGGAETFFHDAVSALDRQGLDQIIVTRPHHAGRLRGGRAAVYVAPFGRWLKMPTRHVLAHAFERHNPDIVQYWMGRAASFAERRGAVNVGWFGGYYDLKRYRNCDWFVGVTQDIVEHVKRNVDDPARCRLIHTIAELDDAPSASRKALDTPAEAPLLLALARLHEKKGLDVLLDAMPDLAGAYLWIAGEGPLREQLEAQAARLGVSGRVRFLGWRTDRAALLRASDICVFPSRYEPFGTVMVEAWATGTPLVAAAAAGPRAYVKDGENGLLVPIDDPRALALAVRRCMADPLLRARLSEGGRESWRANFTEQTFVRTITGFYDEVLSARRGRS
ncbi:MAG: glycosyltransferase [Alphaproteobacteria bacterium]|nr:glycosyltransferase [Alphaproteobacteria bacterium]